MGKKRTLEEKKIHLLKKVRKLDEKIKDLEPDRAISDLHLQSPSNKTHNEDIENDEIDENINPETLDELVEEVPDLSDPTTENVAVVSAPPIEDEIDKSILDILGEAPAVEKKAQSLHRQVTDRWLEILQKGMKKEEKENIFKDNPAFANCDLMTPPKLNPEVSAALAETAKRRDQLIEKGQQQVSTALACVGSALQICIKEDLQTRKLDIIKHLNDASKLLCDSIYLDTKGRRSLVLSVINKDMKEFLVQSEPKDYLFGQSLGEKIKTAKTVQKTASDLKIVDNNKKIVNKQNAYHPRKGFTTNKALNWRGPPRADLRTTNAGAGGPSFTGYKRFQNFNQRKRDEKPFQHTRK